VHNQNTFIFDIEINNNMTKIFEIIGKNNETTKILAINFEKKN